MCGWRGDPVGDQFDAKRQADRHRYQAHRPAALHAERQRRYLMNAAS
jgi:hypothetical protein